MSELPNLIWVWAVRSPGTDHAFGGWSANQFFSADCTAYVPASEFEQAQDKLAEYGEEIARLRAKIDEIYKDMADARYDH